MNQEIVPLGYHCNVSFLLRQSSLIQQSSLFEWFESQKLQYITNVITKLNNNQKIIFEKKRKAIYFEKIFSKHYIFETYEPIFLRRFARFLNVIRNENDIFFVRINPIGQTTSPIEIENFIECIKNINPLKNINFLLVDVIESIDDFKPIRIENIKFNHNFFLVDKNHDQYFKNNELITKQFYKYLKELGLNTEKYTYIFKNFDDKD